MKHTYCGTYVGRVMAKTLYTLTGLSSTATLSKEDFGDGRTCLLSQELAALLDKGLQHRFGAARRVVKTRAGQLVWLAVLP